MAKTLTLPKATPSLIEPPHRPLLLLLFLLAALLTPSQAIFEDQVGLWDWHQQYIGRVTHAVFQTQGTGRKRVVVATEQNVVASLNLRRGEIFWRHVLGKSDTIEGLDIALGKYVITLSGGSNLRAWRMQDGQLVWETSLQMSNSPPILYVTSIEVKDKDRLILVLGDHTLYGISSTYGEILWTTDLTALSEGGQSCIQKIVLSPDNKSIYGVGLANTSGFSVWKIVLATGEVTLQEMAKFPGNLSSDKLVVTKDTIIALDIRGEHILTGHIGSEWSVTIHETSVSSLVPDASGKAELLTSTLEGVFILQFADQILLVKIGSPDRELEVLKKFEQPAAISPILELPDNKKALAIVQHVGYPKQDRKVSLSVILKDGENEEILNDLVELDSEKGIVQQVHLNAYIRLDRSYGFRALIVAEDDSLSLLQQGEIVWSREDGLASIVDTSTADLPLEREGISVARVEHSLIEWLKGHLLKVKATLMLANTEDMAVVQALRLNNAEKNKLTRDHNGFRKLLIVLTKAGKILALHTGDGRIVWSLLLPAFRHSARKPHPVPLKLLPWQVPHKHALDENPVLLLVGKSGLGIHSVGILAWVDVYTGRELSSVELNYSVDQVIPLPSTDSSEQRLHLVVDSNANVYLFPVSKESLELFLDQMPNTYFYIVDKEKGVITGYSIKGPEEVSGLKNGDSYSFASEKIWSVTFPTESERIVTTTTRRQDEVVHTQAKVLTNQDVLYKYLSKNLLFVATVAPRGSGMIGGVSPDETWLVAYVIDTVTGRILHRVKHPNMQGPVHAVFSENWVVYHYFNLRAHRFEMSVIEMYDKNRMANKNVMQIMLGRHNATAPVSAYSHIDLDVKSQSYFFTHSVKAMTVTATTRGITAKQILLSTIRDQVLALDKRFFDPRRSLNPTPAEREDGIIPLTDSIPINPQSYLTHACQVENLRGIVTIPASLESTSLVFAYGLDLFYTQTAPSRMYDSLTEDFSYALLLITIAALLIAIAITWILSERKELKERWK